MKRTKPNKRHKKVLRSRLKKTVKKVARKAVVKRKNAKLFTKPVYGLENYFKFQKKARKKRISKSRKTVYLLKVKIRAAKTQLTKRRKAANRPKRQPALPAGRAGRQAFLYYYKRHPLFFISTGILTVTAATLTWFFVLKDLPNPTQLTLSKPPMTTIIRDRNGLILYRVYNNTNRVQLSFEEIPAIVKNSTIAIEDSSFYQHQGISIKSIMRAFLNNIKEEDIDYYQGGSTITQQLIKNRFFSPVKSYQRKAKEIILSVWTEFVYSKEEILTMYLNTVGYGGPAYGIEAAAQMYFNKPAKDLSLAESAFLAGLPAAPTTFSPYGSNPQLATIRKQQVLERMLKLEMITEDEYYEAVNEKIAFAPQRIDIKAPHFVMFVKNELVESLGEKAVEEGGLDVTTTLDLDIQKKAEEVVRKNIADIGTRFNIHNAATLVTNPKSGEILAMVGSVDYFDADNDGHYNGTTALRQPGSSIKPVNYGYAFDHGYTPGTTIIDSPVVYRSPGSREVYAPVNYDGKFHGTVTVRSALANSYNVPAVKTLEKMGVDNMIKQGIAMGIKSWNNIPPVGLSLTLGGAEVTMLDMARAYGTIANMGVKKELKSVVKLVDNNLTDITSEFYRDNSTLVSTARASDSEGENVLGIEDGDQVLTPLSAYWLTDIMADNVARLPAFGNYAKLTVPNHKVAVKTGTSNNFRDNWTIGFTPDYLVATWVGNNDGSFMNKYLVSGITGAAPIWNEVMSYLLKDVKAKDFEVPQGLVPVKVCATNGLLTCANCPQEKTEYFTYDKIPTKKCFFRAAAECAEAKTQAEGKSDEEKKALLSGCPTVN